MSARPNISCFLYDLKNPISSNHPLWNSPLPMHRNACHPPGRRKSADSVNYGDYFEAAATFLKKNQYRLLSAAVSHQIQRTITPLEIREIRVCLEKHGAFYHPARVDVVGADFSATLVLNMAVSRLGKDCIKEEYGFLERLHPINPGHFLPKVYGWGNVPLKKDRKLAMFLGEWFHGFHEFHLSRDPLDDSLKIKLWDSEHGGGYLSGPQRLELYRQAARILSICYTVDTTRHISSWHHASGDFVAKLDNNAVDVKLISVRRYESALKKRDRNPASLLHALLVFFLNLTIRMRLDRLDGTGDLVWSDDMAVPGCLLGFVEGLVDKPGIDGLPGPVVECFLYQIANLGRSDLMEISRALIEAYPQRAPEIHLIRRHLPGHIEILCQEIHDFGGPFNGRMGG